MPACLERLACVRSVLVLVTCFAPSIEASGQEASSAKLADVVLPDDSLPKGCTTIDGQHAISIQAATLYSMDLIEKVVGGKPVARQYQSMRCKKGEGTVFYYE